MLDFGNMIADDMSNYDEEGEFWNHKIDEKISFRLIIVPSLWH